MYGIKLSIEKQKNKPEKKYILTKLYLMNTNFFDIVYVSVADNTWEIKVVIAAPIIP